MPYPSPATRIPLDVGYVDDWFLVLTSGERRKLRPQARVLLAFFADHPGVLLSYREIWENPIREHHGAKWVPWDDNDAGQTNLIQQAVSRLKGDIELPRGCRPAAVWVAHIQKGKLSSGQGGYRFRPATAPTTSVGPPQLPPLEGVELGESAAVRNSIPFTPSVADNALHLEVRQRGYPTKELAEFASIRQAEIVDLMACSTICGGDKTLAKLLCDRSRFISLRSNQVLVERHGPSGGMFIMLEGTCRADVDDSPVRRFGPGAHFGGLEMVSAPDEQFERRATVQATSDLLVAFLGRVGFFDVAETPANWKLWRNLAGELARRLRETEDERTKLAHEVSKLRDHR